MKSLALFVLCVAVFAQTPPAAPDRPIVEGQGLPPRAAPSDYQAHAQAGAVTIAADFAGHSVATPEAVLSTDDYVVIEAGLFGPPEARLMLSIDDFSLRVNGKKAVPRQPYELVVKNLKDPDYEPPATTSSKTNITSGGGGGSKDLNAPPPPPPPIPVELRRAWEQRVRKSRSPREIAPCPRPDCFSFPMGARPTASARLS